MIDNLKINTTGQAEIIDIYAWMDGGSVTVKLATLNNEPFLIEFRQKADMRVTESNKYPGRLLLNNILVDIRSDLEANVIAILKKAIYSDNSLHETKDFRECLQDAIKFVETNDYILLANQIN